MAKARVDWAFGERPVSSSKLDQANTDYITPGLPIWDFAYSFFWDSTLTPAAVLPDITLGWYPYNPQKSVANRLYLIGYALSDGAADSPGYEISFNGGASWTNAFPSITAAPVVFGAVASTLAEIWDLGAQVATFQWLGIRYSGGLVSANFTLRFLGFLYNSTDTPF